MTRDNAPEPNPRTFVRASAEIKGIIPGFLERRHEDVESLLEALEQEDYPAIQLLGHRLKGDGGSYGFDVISAIGRCLEQAAENKDPREIRKLASELSDYLERVEVAYE